MNRFIVGTGRCGSTLLARMLAHDPSLLMIFEFFSGLDIARRFEAGPVRAADFASLLSQDTPALTMVTKRGHEIDEVVYPWGEHMRYRRGERIPWIVAAALSRMHDDPDRLFDETLEFVSKLPTQPMSRHYRRLFDWYAGRFGRELWIEKSGSSIEYLDALHRFYPDGRFLHLHRDARETALSMREHHVYRLWVAMLYGSPEEMAVANEALAELDPNEEPGPDDAITRMLREKPPVEYFGRYWSDLTVRGMREVGRLDAHQYMELRFEELLVDPATALGKVGDFFGLDPGRRGWIDAAAALVRGTPPTRYEQLSGREQERLDEACRAGRQLLGQLE